MRLSSVTRGGGGVQTNQREETRKEDTTILHLFIDLINARRTPLCSSSYWVPGRQWQTRQDATPDLLELTENPIDTQINARLSLCWLPPGVQGYRLLCAETRR